MSTITTAQEQLRTGWRALQTQRQASCDLWNDPIRQRFDREFWVEFERTVPAALKEIEQLAKVIAQAQRELGR